MFGKPQWFREKTWGWGLVPITWQGYAYAVAWMAVLAGPFWLLASLARVPEAFAWMAVSLTVLVLDVRQILKAMHAPARSPHEELFYIGDEPPANLVTRNYDMQLRDQA